MVSDIARSFLHSDCHVGEHESRFPERFIDRGLNTVELEGSVRRIRSVVERIHGRKPMALIDGYDSPLRDVGSECECVHITEAPEPFLLQTLESNDHVHQSIITGKQVDGIPKCEVSPADLGARHALETVIGTTDDGEGDRDMPAGSL